MVQVGQLALVVQDFLLVPKEEKRIRLSLETMEHVNVYNRQEHINSKCIFLT